MTDFVNWAAWALLACAQWSARALSVTFVLEMLESTNSARVPIRFTLAMKLLVR